jgi:uncharacterized protein
MSSAAAPALLGGLAIGASVAAFALIAGRVTGISGHLHRLLSLSRPSDGLLLAGLAAGGYLAQPAFIPADALPLAPLRVAAAGALVGAGSALANGCTSGHAVCGLSRLSRRSITAVATFMVAAGATVALTDTTELLLAGTTLPATATASAKIDVAVAAVVLATAAVPMAWLARRVVGGTRGAMGAAAQAPLGLAFAGGLVASGMAVPLQVASFFALGSPAWDPSLALVFPGALAVGGLAFWAAAHSGACCQAGKPAFPSRTAAADRRLFAGSVLFGVGWGLAGLCPGPALVLAGAAARLHVAGDSELLTTIGVYIAAFAAGSLAAQAVPADPPAAAAAVTSEIKRGRGK